MRNLLTISLSYLGEFVLHSHNSEHYGLRGLSLQRGKCFHQGIQQESHYIFSHILFSNPFRLLAGVIDLNYQEEIELMLHDAGREEHVWHPGDS